MKKQYDYKYLLKISMSYLGLCIIIILFSIVTNGRLFAMRNLVNIFNNFFSICLGAMGIVFLTSLGEMDLSLGAAIGFAAAVGTYAAELNTGFILPAALFAGMLVGLINGLCIAKLHVPSFICTISMMFIFRGLTTFLLNGTRSIPYSFHVFDSMPIKICTLLLLLAILAVTYNKTAFGKQCRAIGSAAMVAKQSGVKVSKNVCAAFLIPGAICGLLAVFSLARTSTASVATGSGFEFDVLLAVLFGGITLSGGWAVRFSSTFVGAITIAIMKSGMSIAGINGLTQQLIQGILLITIAYISFDRRNLSVIK